MNNKKNECETITEHLLEKKLEEDNKIDIQAYKKGLLDMYKEVFKAKDINKEKPSNDEIIVFKIKDNNVFPEIGIFQSFEEGVEEIYVPANDDVEQLENIKWWIKIPI